LCEDADSGDTTLIVSSSSLSNSECVVGNVAPLHEVFEELRSGAGGTLDIFIYNRVTREGEFLRYNDGGLNVSGYYLSGGAVSIDYERLNTSLYVIEEYAFQLDTDTDTLQVSINGEDEVLRAVAFSVTGFQVRAEMSDGA